MKAPRVSVISLAYNAEKFYARTAATVLAQSFRDFELIVVNDGSRDGTSDVVREIMQQDSRVRLINQENSGIAGARNRGVAEARGEYVALLDHDDLWHPDKLQLQVERLDRHPQAGLVGCYSALLDLQGRCSGWRLGGGPEGWVYPQMIAVDLISGGSVALIRRSALKACGPFDTGLRMRSDWDMWIRLARQFQVCCVRRVLVGYTRGSAGVSANYEAFAQAGRQILRKAHKENRFETPSLRFCLARDSFCVACFCLIDQRIKLSWRYLLRSLRETPAPVLTSPRRIGVTVILVLASVFPPALREWTFSLVFGSLLGIEPGSVFPLLKRRNRLSGQAHFWKMFGRSGSDPT